MQATSMKRFVVSPSGGMVIAFSILIAGVVGVAALTLGNDHSGNQTVESARVMPQAYVSAGQGEGLVDASSNLTSATALWPRAFVSPGQGEGFVDATNAAAKTNRLQAHIGLGQGEGLVDATHQRPEPRTIKAYSHPEQGEGLVDPSN